MSVERTSPIATSGACAAGGYRGVNGGQCAELRKDGLNDEFGAILSSLGADGVESTEPTSAFAETLEDQSETDTSILGNSLGGAFPFPSTTQMSKPQANQSSLDGSEGAGIELSLTQMAVDFEPDDERVIAKEARATDVLAGTEYLSQSQTLVGQSEAVDTLEPYIGTLSTKDSHIPDVFANTKQMTNPQRPIGLSEGVSVFGLGSLGAKSARLTKERVNVEASSGPTAVSVSADVARDSSKLGLHVLTDKTVLYARGLERIVEDVLPLEGGQLTEFRREKSILKVNMINVGSDVGVPSSLDLRPVSVGLEGLAPDVGSGMSQSDQNPDTYWMSSDMKKAEIRLDGFGESSVEVSISVHGNQAHVAFRSDEAQTRQALEDAGGTLKEMLGKEGLDLAGVSVGTSGAGGGSAQDRRAWQDSRLKNIDNLASKFPSETSSSFISSRAGQLDIFV